jgi:hypothetical protein
MGCVRLPGNSDGGRIEVPLVATVKCRRKIEMSPGAQSRDDTRVGGGHDERDLDCIPAVRLSSDLIASADRD